MVLRGDLGTEVMEIKCDFIGADVVIHNEDAKQVQGRVGRAVTIKPGTIPHAPEDCPLAVEPTSRTVGHFAVCIGCPHAAVVSTNGLIEC